jgi:hypothetical protein
VLVVFGRDAGQAGLVPPLENLISFAIAECEVNEGSENCERRWLFGLP